MRYLAISSASDKIAFSIFDNTTLKLFGIKLFETIDGVSQASELYDFIENLIKEHEIDILVVKWFDYYKLNNKRAFDLINYRSILRVVSGKNAVVYLEIDSYGYEKSLPSALNDKIRLLSNSYGINIGGNDKMLVNDLKSTVEAILLGEAIAHQRIHERFKQPIEYKWGLKR